MTTRGMTPTCLGLMVLVCLVLGVGCDSGKSGSAGQTAGKDMKKLAFDPKTPCNLLTKAEIEAVMKLPVAEPERSDYACTYASADPSKFAAFYLTVTDQDGPGLFNGMKEYAAKSGRKVRQVDGVGEGAFFDQGFLHVLKGKYCFVFHSDGSEGLQMKEDAVAALVRTAMEKLP